MTTRCVLTLAVLAVALTGVPATAQTPPKAAPRTSVPAKPAAVASTSIPQGITNADVVNMVGAGLSEAIVVASIRNAKERSFDLTPAGLVALKKANVPDSIIAVMLNPGAAPSVASARPAPVLKELKIADGSEVRLSLKTAASSATARVEDRINFEVIEALKVDGVVVIDAGAVATGRVTEAQGKRSFGRSGKLNFTIDSVKAVDGQSVRLRAARETQGADSFGKAGVVTILTGPFGALVRGKDVEIPAGTEYTIYIDGDRTIQLKPAP